MSRTSAADPREERLRAGRAALGRLGIAAAAPVADFERALETDPAAAMAVAERLGDHPSPESVALLRRLAEQGDKHLRREARRSLYRLAQRGVVAPEAAPPPQAAAPGPAIFAGPEPEGYLSPFDPRGDRLFWILKPRTGGGLLQVSVVVNEPDGLRELMLAEVGRKAIRTLRSEMEKRHGLRLVDVDWRYADRVASEGYERTKRHHPVLEESVASWPQLRIELFGKPVEPRPAPVDAVIPPDTDLAADLAASGSVFEEEPLLGFWILPDSAMAPHIARYREMRDSPILLDRFQQTSRLDELVAAALGEAFAGEAGDSWRRRLEEMAYYLWKTERRESARRLAAAARELGRSPAGGKGIPFFEALVRRTFGVYFTQEAEKEREERAGSVIVTPEEIREQQARARHRPPRG